MTQPDDAAEREAEHVADRVAPRGAGSGEERRSPLPFATQLVWDAVRSSSRPLAWNERPAVGIDLSTVRVHTGSLAAESARALAADAYTVGDDLVLGEGYDAGSPAGRRLVAHELAHVAAHRDRRLAAVGRQPVGGGKRAADPDADRARDLAKLLRGDPQEALKQLDAMKEPELSALDAAAARALRSDDARLVHRGADFVRYRRAHPTPRPKTGAVPGKGEEGDPATKTADAEVEGGKVEVHTAAGASKEGYSLTYSATEPHDTAEARWLQFAWREVVSERPGKGRKGVVESRLESRLPRSTTSDALFYYWLTTDKDHPDWNTDTSDKSSPFFEEGTGTVTRSAKTLEMYDRPTPQDALVQRALTAPDPPAAVVERFHAATYLVLGMSVVYKADVTLSWRHEKPAPGEAAKPTTFSASATGGPTHEIAPEHRARLEKQFGDVDYLGGKPLPTPHLRPRFEFVRERLSEPAWSAKTEAKERYADVARLAQADRIDDVWEMSANAINEMTQGKDGEVAKPGLNLAAKGLSTTGFVDDKGVFHPVIPVSERGPLPRVAIVIAMTDLDPRRGEAFALASVRHEMEHARHCELAIEWLHKWRDARPGKPFATWIASQVSDANLLAVLNPFTREKASKADSELLAHIEGFVASAQFLPAAPDLALMSTGDYPAAIAELKMLGQPENAGWISDAAALNRVHDLCCSGLDAKQRTALLAWLDALLDPTLFKPKPGSKSDESTVKIIREDFGSGTDRSTAKLGLRTLVEHVRAAAAKPCPRR